MKYLLILILFITSCTDKKQTPEPIVASYGVEPELFWLEEYTSNKRIDIEYLYTYSFIYYEPISNQYYFATIEKTNNISYNTNNLIDEENYIDYKMFQAKTSFFYVGSTDLTNRIYIDNDKNLYIKKLKLINDTHYYDQMIIDSLQHMDNPSDSDYKKAKKAITSSFIPHAQYASPETGSMDERIYYSNENQNFNRSLAQEPYIPNSPYSRGELIEVGFR